MRRVGLRESRYAPAVRPLARAGAQVAPAVTRYPKIDELLAEAWGVRMSARATLKLGARAVRAWRSRDTWRERFKLTRL